MPFASVPLARSPGAARIPTRIAALRIVFYYTAAGVLWTLVTDWVSHTSLIHYLGSGQVEWLGAWCFLAASATILGFGLDRYFHQLRETAERLQASEARFRSLFEHSADGILVLDPESGRFEAANPAAVSLYGAASESALCGASPWELFPRTAAGRANFGRLLPRAHRCRGSRQMPCFRVDPSAAERRGFPCTGSAGFRPPGGSHPSPSHRARHHPPSQPGIGT